MKSLYFIALVLLLECSSIYTLPTVTPQTATQSGGCDIQSINYCLRNMAGSTQNMFASLLSSSENNEAMCRNYTSAKACMLPYLAGGRCSGVQAVGFNTIINGYDYLCSDRGRQTTELFGTCFGNRSAITSLQQCNLDIVNHIDTNNLCTLPQFYLHCSLNVAQMYCNLNVSRALIELVLTLFQAYTDVYNCTYNFPDLGTVPTRMPTNTTPSWITNDIRTDQPVTSRPSACSISVIRQCLSSLSGHNAILPWQRGQSGNISDIDIDLACITYDSIKYCYRNAVKSCSPIETIEFELLMSMYEYVCTPTGKQQFKSLYQCLSNKEALSKISQCSNMTGLDISNYCSLPNHFISCSANVSRDYCNSSPALAAIVRASFKPYQTVLNCSLTTDTPVPQTSQPPLPTTTTPSWITNDIRTDQPVTSRPSCSFSVIGQCLSSLSGHNAILPWQRGQSGNISDIDIDLACITYDSIKYCYRNAVKSCSPDETIQFELLMSMYEYVCTPTGKQQFRSLYQCLSNKEALSKISQCSNMTGLDISNYCSLPNHFISCSANVSRDYCNSSPALAAIVRASFKPYQTVLNCSLTPDTPVPQTSQPPTCSFSVIGQCLSSLSAAILPWQRGQSGDISDIDIDLACIMYDSIKGCYRNAVKSCSQIETIPFELLMSMYEYVCTPTGKQHYQSLRQCFSNQQAVSFMSKCSNVSGVDLSNYCNIPEHSMSCANEASRKFCNSTPALLEIVKASFKPYETTFNCDLSDSDTTDGNNSNTTDGNNSNTTDGNNSNPTHPGNFLIITALMLATAVFL